VFTTPSTLGHQMPLFGIIMITCLTAADWVRHVIMMMPSALASSAARIFLTVSPRPPNSPSADSSRATVGSEIPECTAKNNGHPHHVIDVPAEEPFATSKAASRTAAKPHRYPIISSVTTRRPERTIRLLRRFALVS
jgi:hypothetical protein